MKSCLALLVTFLVFTTARSFAREPQPPPSPTATGSQTPGEEYPKSIYVGHYGELLEIHDGWTAEPTMAGETEVIYFHPKFKDGLRRRQPYQPPPSDYTAENFSPMRLMELVVIPKNAPGSLRSLDAIRRAREAELRQSHADFDINAVSDDKTWPLGTFHVQIKRPYRLWQIYSESANEFYTLTLGGPIKIGDYGLDINLVSNYNSADTLLRRSLSSHLRAVYKQSVHEYLFQPLPSNSHDFLEHFKRIAANTRYWIILGALFFSLILPAFWAGSSQRVRRANLIARSFIFFSVVMGLLGFLSIYIPASWFGVTWRHSAAPELIPLVLAPWISWLAAKRLRSSRSNYVLLWSALFAGLMATFSFLGNEAGDLNLATRVAFANASLFLLLGLVFGIVFVLSLGPVPTEDEKR